MVTIQDSINGPSSLRVTPHLHRGQKLEPQKLRACSLDARLGGKLQVHLWSTCSSVADRACVSLMGQS